MCIVHYYEWDSFLISLLDSLLARMYRKGNLFALLVGMYISIAIMENDMAVPQKIKD